MESTETIITDQKVEKKTIENRWDRTLIILACFFLFVSSVLSGLAVYQGNIRNKRIDKIDKIVFQARKSADSADKTVKAAVASAKSPAAVQQAVKINAALDKIQENSGNIEDIKTIVQEIRSSLNSN